MRLAITAQELRLLRMLLARAGEAVSMAELKCALWDDAGIPPDGVTQCLASLRVLLQPVECIENIYNRGYRISVPVNAENMPDTPVLQRLVILPFTSGYGVPEYFTSAILEHAMEQLSDACAADVSMAPQDSVLALMRRGLSALEIGKKLEADLVLSGMLHATPTHIRLRAELRRGETGAPLWTEDVLVESGQTVELMSIFVNRLILRLQGNSAKIKAAVKPEVESESAPRQREAYELYLRARYEWKTYERHRMQDGMGHLLRAMELDPNLIGARIDLTHLCVTQAVYGSLSPRLAAAMIRRTTHPMPDFASHAVAMAPALGWVSFYVDRNLPEALRQFSLTTRLPHDLWLTPMRAMFALSRHRFDEAIDLLQKAIHIDPYTAWLYIKLAWALHLAGEAEASVEQARKTIEQFPERDGLKLYSAIILSYNGEAASVLEITQTIAARMPQYDLAAATYAYVLACAKQTEEARAVLERLQWFSRERFVLNTFSVAAYVALGDTAAALAELRTANENRCPWFFQMLADPRLKPLHGNPEFEAMRALLPLMEAEAEKEPPREECYLALEAS